MSYALHPYAVSVAAIKKQLGSRDARLLTALTQDFPAIGFLLEAEIPPVAMALAGVKDSVIDDDEIRESVNEVRTWLDACSRTHSDLVCFYH